MVTVETLPRAPDAGHTTPSCLQLMQSPFLELLSELMKHLLPQCARWASAPGYGQLYHPSMGCCPTALNSPMAVPIGPLVWECSLFRRLPGTGSALCWGLQQPPQAPTR